MKILVITNASLTGQKFKTQNEIIKAAAEELGIEIEFKKNNEIFYSLPNSKFNIDADAILFYDKDILLCKTLEKHGYKVYNSSDAIYSCDNKAETYYKLASNNIKIPKTYIFPLTFYYDEKLADTFITNLENNLSYPIVAKKWYGSEGQQVFLINNKKELKELINKEQGKELLFQEFYKECYGQDVRIVIIDQKFVAAMKRKSTNGDFRSNLSSGGTAEKYLPTLEEISLAISSAKVLKCDFCGVDILQTNNGPVICEVNSNSHLKNIFDVTNVNVAKIILKYIKSKN